MDFLAQFWVHIKKWRTLFSCKYMSLPSSKILFFNGYHDSKKIFKITTAFILQCFFCFLFLPFSCFGCPTLCLSSGDSCVQYSSGNIEQNFLFDLLFNRQKFVRLFNHRMHFVIFLVNVMAFKFHWSIVTYFILFFVTFYCNYSIKCISINIYFYCKS